MAAANTDLLRKSKSIFATTLASDITDSDGTIACNSLAGLPTDTAVTLTIDKAGTREVVTGVVSSNNLTNCLRGQGGTSAAAHSSGDTVQAIFEQEQLNDMVDWGLVEHTQAGKHKFASQAQGDVLYFDGTDWVRLAAGTSGYFLKTQGAAANPVWAAVNVSLKVLQIVYANYGTELQMASTSYATTGLTASITPSSASSKVLIIAGVPSFAESGNQCILTLFRGTVAGTNLGQANWGMARLLAGTGNAMASQALIYMDAPNTTSATTYTVGIRAQSTSNNVGVFLNGGIGSLVIAEVTTV